MGHDHDHGHSHGGASFGRAFVIGISLNLLFVAIEVAFGIRAHSMSLIADAGHNFGDVLGLGLAFGAALLSRKKPSARRTYGYRRSSILAALANAILLVLATGAIIWESIGRLRQAAPVEGGTMMIVSAAGVVINAFAALLFASGRERDINVRSAFSHLAADALLSLGVLVAGAIIHFTHWNWLDPAVGIALSLTILVTTWSLLRDSLDMILDAVPEKVDADAVLAYLRGLPGVSAVHDLHIWPISTTDAALTAHLVMADPCDARFLVDVCEALQERFQIEHPTLQIDPASTADDCKLAPDDAV